jgi:malate/lactate dehydrogenase
MQDVAILGAGEQSGSLAYVLARRGLVSRVRLIDATGQVAAGKALDIMQASAMNGSATQVAGSTDISMAAGAAILVIADRADGTEWSGDDGLRLLTQLTRIGAKSVVLCLGATQRDLVERGVRELGFAPNRLFGSAPEAFASTIRALVALESNVSPRDVALTVLGVPPDHAIVPWEDATIGGIAATRVLDEPSRRRLAARVAPLWPPGPYALATAASEAIACMLGQSRRVVSCFVAPDDSEGQRAKAAALPVRLGQGGIIRVDVPTLSVSARVSLDNAMLL